MTENELFKQNKKIAQNSFFLKCVHFSDERYEEKFWSELCPFSLKNSFSRLKLGGGEGGEV